MNFLNIAIPTAMLWIVDGVIVVPLAQELARRKLGLAAVPVAKPVPLDKGVDTRGPRAYDGGDGGEKHAYGKNPTGGILPSDETTRHFKQAFTLYYILVDVILLGGLGFLTGLFGFFFIGIAFKAKAWPGMIAFILASMTGYFLLGIESGI